MRSDRTLTIAGLIALCGCGVLSALLEMLLVPLYAGSTLVPITVVFAIGGNIVLVLLGRELVPSGVARVAPFIAWSLTVIGVTLFPRPEGDVILPGGGGGVEWVGYGVVLGGLVAGIVTSVFTSPRPQRPPRPPRPTAPTTGQPVNG
ncbi:MAG TPA: hypothetical protein VKQ07_01010 [Jatrophihabitantaceae bacterium]|nr:hypothetical protein [Jatrophihabitantaceae bacterium]